MKLFYAPGLGYVPSIEAGDRFWIQLKSWQIARLREWLEEIGVNADSARAVTIVDEQTIRVTGAALNFDGLMVQDPENPEEVAIEEYYVFYDQLPDFEKV